MGAAILQEEPLLADRRNESPARHRVYQLDVAHLQGRLNPNVGGGSASVRYRTLRPLRCRVESDARSIALRELSQTGRAKKAQQFRMPCGGGLDACKRGWICWQAIHREDTHRATHSSRIAPRESPRCACLRNPRSSIRRDPDSISPAAPNPANSHATQVPMPAPRPPRAQRSAQVGSFATPYSRLLNFVSHKPARPRGSEADHCR